MCQRQTAPCPNIRIKNALGHVSTNVPPSHVWIIVRHLDTHPLALHMHVQPWWGLLRPLLLCLCLATGSSNKISSWVCTLQSSPPCKKQTTLSVALGIQCAMALKTCMHANPRAIFRGPCKTDGSLFPRVWDHKKKHACVCTCILTERVACNCTLTGEPPGRTTERRYIKTIPAHSIDPLTGSSDKI